MHGRHTEVPTAAYFTEKSIDWVFERCSDDLCDERSF